MIINKNPPSPWLTVLASFGVMLCLGGVYAWSIFVPYLKEVYGFSTSQTQLVFGTLIAVFPTTMIVAGRLEQRLGARGLTVLSALFFFSGYALAGLSGGRFPLILLGVGVLGGIGTGMGYLASLITPVRWFPKRKGLITGVAAAGFGLAAVTLTYWAEFLLHSGVSLMYVFSLIGIIYGVIILLLSPLMRSPKTNLAEPPINPKDFMFSLNYLRLIVGIFCGTFAGLLIIGNLKSIGMEHPISNSLLLLGISVFAIGNFGGRLTWGWASDYIGAKWAIVFSLALQGFFILLIGHLWLTELSYVLLSLGIGFCFGANFVLFAKETAHLYGVSNMSRVYPFVFLGYALAGILGPLTGGLLFDAHANYTLSSVVAATISIVGSITFANISFSRVILPSLKLRQLL